MCRRVQDAVHAVQDGDNMRFLPFLSDREQILATSVLNKIQFKSFQYSGGYESAERKMLCIYNVNGVNIFPISTLKVKIANGQDVPTHRDYLGALMALSIKRENIGDIVVFAESAVLFVHERVEGIIERELTSAGRTSISVCKTTLNDIDVESANNKELLSASVPSLRLDAIISTFLNTSRSSSVQIINSRKVEINHILNTSQDSKVFIGDVFTVKGSGKFKLVSIGGKSKKGRTYIKYEKY